MDTAPRWQPVRTGSGVDADLVRRCDEAMDAALHAGHFFRPGRCGWLPLPDGRSWKLKGVGSWAGPDAKPEPPSATSYLRAHAHFGFADDGRPTIVDSAPAPFGGITLSRAEREFDIGEALYAGHGWGLRPVRLYRLVEPRVRFPHPDGEPLGAVASVLPTAAPYRCDALFGWDEREPEAARFTAEVRRGRTLAATVVDLAGQYGAALRQLTELQVFRHSGSLDNWAVAPESGRVFLTDLDSCQWLDSVAPPRRPREVLRDLASGLFNLATTVMLPALAEPDGAPEAMVDAFGALATRYFADAPGPAVTAGVAPFLRYWQPLAQRSWAGAGARVVGAPRAVWIDRDLGYCLLVAGLATVYPQTSLANRWPLGPPEALAHAARAFLGPGKAARFDAFLTGSP